MEAKRCEICPACYACIPADGPMDASIYLVGERPGQWEEANARKGYLGYQGRKCFVGPTGEELNSNYLGLAGLGRDSVRCANTVRCGSDHNKKPTAKEIASCSAHFLKADLEAVNPKVVVLMGATACANFKDREIDLDVEHGIPFHGKLWDWEGWIVPHYHPALGMHNTGMMIYLLEDWERLGVWLKDLTSLATVGRTLRPSTDYQLVHQWGDWMTYLLNNKRPVHWMAVDTESHAGKWWSIQISVRPRTGRMFLTKDESLIRGLATFLRNAARGHNQQGHPWRGQFIFHHAPADLPLFQEMGVEVEGKYRDTMVEAYGFGNMRQGLKALGYRLFGVMMKSWEDLVTPYSREKIMDYLIDGVLDAEGLRGAVERFSDKTGKRLKDGVSKIPEERAVKDLLRHVQGNPKYDPWKRLKGDVVEGEEGEDLSRYERLSKWLLANRGPWPKKGIAHVPMAEQIDYAVQDSDMTLQVAMEFDRMRPLVEAGFGVSEYDYDK